MSTETPVYVSEAEIKVQLEKLGYRNVPDEIVQEFVKDLKQQAMELAHSHHFSPNRNSPKPTLVSRDAEKENTASKSYTVATSATTATTTNTTSTRSRKQQQQQQQQHSTPDGPGRVERRPLQRRPNTANNAGVRRPATARPTHRHHHPTVGSASDYSDYSDDTDVVWADLGAPPRQRPSTASRIASRRGFLRTSLSGSRAKPQFKKSDPVSMGAQHRNSWQHDRFLTHGASKRKTKINFPADDTKYPTKKRGPTMKVNRYVIPTAKRRDDVRWATRAKMLDLQVSRAHQEEMGFVDEGYYEEDTEHMY